MMILAASGWNAPRPPLDPARACAPNSDSKKSL